MENNNFPIKPDVVALKDIIPLSFEIPVYQRYYAWDEEQIDDFLTTIINDYSANKKRCFFGTMQFNLVTRNNQKVYEVIDGQQRLITFLLFMHVLRVLSSDIPDSKFCIKFMNDTKAEDTIKHVLKDYKLTALPKKRKTKKTDVSISFNVFDANARMLREKCELYEKNSDIVSYKDLYDYLINKLYVVTLTTLDKEMSLPEIVEIFNTINTTGMDLNGADIFKIQYFDYLKNNYSETYRNTNTWMKRINECYEIINTANINRHRKDQLDMSDALTLYKHFVCALSNKGFKELSKSNELFFEEILKESTPKDYLSFEVFYKVVEIYVRIRTQIETNSLCVGTIQTWSDELIHMTRYSRYWTLPYLYVCCYWFKNRKNSKKLCKNVYEDAIKMSYEVFKYFVVNSTMYAKIITSVQTEICSVIFPLIVALDTDKIKETISSIIWIDPRDPKNLWKDKFKEKLLDNGLANSEVGIRLACMLLALDAEIADTTANEIKQKFFANTPYDVEHIYSWSKVLENYSDKNAQYKMNGLGNLVLLEREINQDMGRRAILLPTDKKNKGCYQKSKYRIVNALIPDLSNWDINKVNTKGIEQANKLVILLSVD